MIKIKKSIQLLLITVLALGIFAGCNNASSKTSTNTSTSEAKGSIAEIKERGKIRIGVFSDKYPFGYVDENGENQGDRKRHV